MSRFLTLSHAAKSYAGILSITFAAALTPIAIRFAQLEGVPSLAIIGLRLWAISLALAPLVWVRFGRELKGLGGRDWGWVLFAGAVHALNLTLLFFSLQYTSILVNSVLRRTSPLWVVGMEILFLEAVFSRRVWLGVLLAVLGAVLVGWGAANAFEGGSQPLLGGALALLNAIMNGVYLLIGRKIRPRISYLPYSWGVFFTAGLLILVVLGFTHTAVTGYSAAGYFWVLIVTIASQIFGHIPINAVLRYFTATTLSTALQVSVVIAAVAAIFTLGEFPAGMQIFGSVLILGGVGLVIRG